jgi:hypothetical protein
MVWKRMTGRKPISLWGEKHEGLKLYKQAMKEKEDYEKAQKKLEREEFNKSPLGQAIHAGVKPTQFKPRALPQTIQVGENLTKEQRFLNDLFGGNGTLGQGINLPKVRGVLISGNGLINNEDYGDTGSMFGVKRRTR